MPGRQPWAKLHNRLIDEVTADPERKKLYDEIRHETAQAVALGELRRARRLTQQQLAQKLHMTQASVSQLEHRADLYLSTLRAVIEAMGGELQVYARFEDATVPLAIGEGAQYAG